MEQKFQPGFRQLIFGANLVVRIPLQIFETRMKEFYTNLGESDTIPSGFPHDSIIIQFEQLYEGSPWLHDNYIELLRKYRVWDYSQYNIDYLSIQYDIKAEFFYFGYQPSLQFPMGLPGLVQNDGDTNESNSCINVLFYGGVTPRRQHIQLQLMALGVIGVEFWFYEGLYGQEKIDRIRQAKIVLNIHGHDPHLLEYPRISQLLANQKFIITEKCRDMDQYQFLKPKQHHYLSNDAAYGLIEVNYDDLLPVIIGFLSPEKDQQRQQIAENGFIWYSNHPSIIPID